ncbi:hypothetical protein KO566_06880 [Flavobacteriaceae bacterium XHP0103]|uniref:hypothetical protein n=1 Tax=Marixanthotalea marina TaxID=2844359 RepID=UPI002989A9FC|nr:hypothetical protein [Marixanthotalea marina]MBU3821780.1 hypothetical protein [Marixanthotalea marina]
MKKLLVIALALVVVQVNAQQRMERPNRKDLGHKMSMLTPEESAELQTKRMTLQLDLSKEQQKDMYALNLKNAQQRQATMEARKAKRESSDFERPTKEERLSMMNAQLDHQIATKAKIKSILNADQYEKWQTSNEHRAKKFALRDNKRFAQRGTPHRKRKI